MNSPLVCMVLGILLTGWISGSFAEDSPVPDPGWGSIDGQFLLDGPYEPQLRFKTRDPRVKDWEVCGCQEMLDETLVVDPTMRGIANIFVYLRQSPERIHPDLKAIPAKAELTAKGCRYMPHCGILRVGQNLNVKYMDGVSHNAHFSSISNLMPGIAIQANEPAGMDLDFFSLPEPLPMKVNCDIHPWMTCYWTVLDHPYAAITDQEGRFQLEKVPVGEHTFRVWHERCGYVIREYKITVTPNCKTVLPTEKVPVAKLMRK